MNVKQKLPLLIKLAGLHAIPEYKFHPQRRWRFDYAIVGIQVAIEFEGLVAEKSRHTGLTGYTADCEKYNAAALAGWVVLRYTALSKETQILDDLHEVAGRIAVKRTETAQISIIAPPVL